VSPHFIHTPADVPVFQITIALVGFTMALSFLVRPFEGFLTAYIRYDVTNAIEIVKVLLRTALIVYFLGRGHGIIALAVITLSVEALANGATMLFVRRYYPALRIHISLFTRGQIRPLYNYSVYSFISNLADQLRFRFNAFIISAFLSLQLVTHYNIAARISDYYLSLIASLTAVMFPVYSKLEGQKDHDQIREKFIFTLKLVTILSVFAGGSIFIYGKAFITRWMGDHYVDSFYVLAILTGGFVFNNIQRSSKTLLYSLSKHRVYSFILSAEGVTNLIISFLLVRPLGIYGVALGTLAPMLVTNLFIIPHYTNRVIGLSYLIHLKTVGAGLALGAAVHLATWLLVRNLITPSFPRIFILGAVTSTLFLTVNVMVLLTREERKYFRIPF